MFSTITLTPPVQQTLTLARLVHKIRSCRAAADDANMFFVPTKIAKQDVEEAVQIKVVSEQNSINDMRRGTMTFLVSSQITDCITRFLYCSRQLLFNVMERFWAVVSCLVWPQHTVWSPQSWLSPRGVRRCLPSPCHALSSHSTVVIRKAPPQWNGRSRCQHDLIS